MKASTLFKSVLPLLMMAMMATFAHAQNNPNSVQDALLKRNSYEYGPDQASLPVGYPKFVDNGNPEADRADYNARKEAWIKANPEAYKKLTSENSQKVHIISQEEFNRMPQEKKDHILENPSMYKISPTKEDKL